MGRYAENRDLDEYWGQILNSLRDALQDDALPDRVAIEAIQSVAKFGLDARGLFALILKWSRNEKTKIRRVCAEAFGKTGTYDQEVIQRLEEMIASDVAEEVKRAAENSLNALQASRAS